MRGTVPGTEETMINNRDQVHTHGLMGKEAENKEADKKKKPIEHAMKKIGY